MKNIDCPVCSNNKIEFLRKYWNYDINRCKVCSLVFSNPFKNPWWEFYESFYDQLDYHNPERYGLNNSQEFFLARNDKWKLLDIACWSWLFIFNAKNKWYEVYWVDFDKKAIKICKEYFKLSNIYTYNVNWDEILTLWLFDYITMFDVLEHVDDPKWIIKSCHRLLKEWWKLIISVPNFNRKPDFIFEECDNPPHHLTKWTVGSLKYLLESSWFSLIINTPNKFTNHDMYMYIKVNTFDKLIKFIKSKVDINNPWIKKSENIESYSPKLYKKILYRLRDLFIYIFKILLTPFTFFFVVFLHFESDHIYVEAKKI